MYGETLKPLSTAFLAKRPAPNITEGFEVLVQLVIAAITTEPTFCNNERDDGWNSETYLHYHEKCNNPTHHIENYYYLITEMKKVDIP